MKQTKEQLVEALDDIKRHVEAGDSFQGSFSYDAFDDNCGPGEFEVAASYRIGNSMGQGGMRIIDGRRL